MQLGVDEVELPFDFVELFFGFHDFRFVLLLTSTTAADAVVDQLVTVPLTVVVDQFPVAFVDFFLQTERQRR